MFLGCYFSSCESKSRLPNISFRACLVGGGCFCTILWVRATRHRKCERACVGERGRERACVCTCVCACERECVYVYLYTRETECMRVCRRSLKKFKVLLLEKLCSKSMGFGKSSLKTRYLLLFSLVWLRKGQSRHNGKERCGASRILR